MSNLVVSLVTVWVNTKMLLLGPKQAGRKLNWAVIARQNLSGIEIRKKFYMSAGHVTMSD